MSAAPRGAAVASLIVMLPLLAASCATRGNATDTRIDIQEAVLRWAFAQERTHLDPPAPHCLVVMERAGMLEDEENAWDPEPLLLARFASDAIRVVPMSACRIAAGPHLVFEVATGRPAVLLAVSPVTEGPLPYVVEVAYVREGEWGSGNSCEATFRANGTVELQCKRVMDF